MRCFLSFLSAALLITGSYLFTRTSDIGYGLPLFYTGFVIASAGFVGLLVWGLPLKRRGWFICFCVLALLPRILALNLLPSDDLARYIWEGRILLEGHNPYSITPEDPRLIQYRDDVYQMVNHKDMPAIYPPLTLYIFAALTKVTRSMEGFRVFMLLIELASIVLMFRWLKTLKFQRERVIIYALNPLVIISIGGHGHLDPIQILLLILGLDLFARKREGLGMMSVTLAGLTKFLALFALPFLITRQTLKFLPICLLLVVGSYIPFFFLEQPFSFGNMGVYMGDFAFYSLTYVPLRWLFGVFGAHLVTVSVLFFFMIGLWPTRTRPEQSIAPFLFLLTMMNTTIHFWYLTPILALSLAWRSRALVGLSLLFLPYFDVFRTLVTEGVWMSAWWRPVLTYVPFLFLFWLEKSGRWPRLGRQLPTIGIVIPVLNDENPLRKLLQSFTQKGIDPGMVVIADGGSSDRSLDVAQQWGAKTVSTSSPGRGIQIRRATELFDTDLIVVVHADSGIADGLLLDIQRAAAAYPNSSGGACRLSYYDKSIKMRILSVFSNIKMSLFGLSFGDQCQWYHRCKIDVPEIPLMEDVEIALQINDCGPAVWIPSVVSVSPRRYQRMGIIGGISSVIRFALGYLFRRKWTGDMPDTVVLYEKYYQSSESATPL
jgi:hypothetical protein